MLLGFIFLFEVFHTFSHIIQIDGSMQTNVIHLITYFINFFVLMVFYNFTKKIPDYNFSIILFLLICFDVYALNNLSIIFYISLQSFIFLSLLFYYYNLLPEFFINKIFVIVLSILLIIIFFLNEIYNGDFMMSKYPNFPFHCLVEITGIFLFYNICSIFYKL